MLISILKGLYPQLKNLKSPIICISGNIAYGSQYDFTCIKTMNINNPSNIFIGCTMDTLKNMIEGLISIDTNLLYIPFYIKTISDKMNTVYSYNYKVPVVYGENVRIDESFYEFDTYKSTDGVFLYRFNKYTVSIFKGLLQLAKKDILNVAIYDNGEHDNSFLADFEIWKSKSTCVHVYVKYNKLN